MDITKFVVGNRDRAFLVGDHGAYRSQLTRQIATLRRRLGRATPKNAKFAAKVPISAEDVGKTREFVHLLLLQAERAWAHAMHMKNIHAETNADQSIAGSTRRHVCSRLHKSTTYANSLAAILNDRATSKATDTDYLEAVAYAASLSGSHEFEKQVTKSHEEPNAAWSKCLTHFAEAHIIYASLLSSTQQDVFKEVLAGPVDQSIRFAAYQSGLPRTVATSTVAKRYFPKDKSDVEALLERIYPAALSEDAATTPGQTASDIPTSMAWRERTVPIADAAIGQALAATSTAAQQLSSTLAEYKSAGRKSSKLLAAAYDPVLNASQDTVDAVRRSITESAKEGFPESDTRMQDLRVSDLAANYALISWRIGRNRVVVSNPGTDDDGVVLTAVKPQTPRAPRTHPRKFKATTAAPIKDNANHSEPQSKAEAETKSTPKTPSPESRSHKLTRLRERLVLYDATLQSLDSLTHLPGASRDTAFLADLTARSSYFSALRCLTIAHSHHLVGAPREALAMFVRASEHASSASSSDSSPLPEITTATATTPPTLTISTPQLTDLCQTITTSLARQRALVTLQQMQADATAAGSTKSTAAPHEQVPLAETLAVWPIGGKVDLANLVTWPPRLRPVPVKPVFLDLAWDFIGYPGQGLADDDREDDAVGAVGGERAAVQSVKDEGGSGKGGEAVDGKSQQQQQQQQQKKKGWLSSLGLGG